MKSSSSKSVKEQTIASLTTQEFNIVPHVFLVALRHKLKRNYKTQCKQEGKYKGPLLPTVNQ